MESQNKDIKTSSYVAAFKRWSHESICYSAIVSVGQHFQYGKKHGLELQLFCLD